MLKQLFKTRRRILFESARSYYKFDHYVCTPMNIILQNIISPLLYKFNSNSKSPIHMRVIRYEKNLAIVKFIGSRKEVDSFISDFHNDPEMLKCVEWKNY